MNLPQKACRRALIVGFGHVGQKLAEILFLEKEKFLRLSGLDLKVIGIITRNHGCLVNTDGLDMPRVLGEIGKKGHFSAKNPDYRFLSALQAVKELEYDVLIEISTLSIANSGEPAVSHIREALKRGRHVVTANKGPVAYAYHELKSLSEEQGCSFLHEATVLDGTPIFNLAKNCLKGCRVTGLTGILNSTTNFILSRLEAGETIEEAVKKTQAMGLAEADPSHDLDGWDAAVKITALANVLMGARLTPADVRREGITRLSTDMIVKNLELGKRFKLICRAWIEGETVCARVAVEEIFENHFFASVSGSSSFVRFETDLMAPLTIFHERPTVADTAYGVINDLMSVSG